MTRPTIVLLRTTLLFAVLCVPSVVRGDDSSGLADEADAIRAAAKQYLTAVQHGDANAIRNMWTPDGDYIDAAGRRFEIDELILRQTGAPQADVESGEVSTPNSSLRLISADVAIEDGTAQLGASADGNGLQGRFTAVWVKRNGRWRLDSLRESVIETSSMDERLRPLEWILGEWAGATENAVVLVTSYVSEGGKFIVREFAIRGDGGGVVSGTERIGWDSAAGQFKSWMFDSHGGRGEGRWQRDGDRWVVEATDVLADGKQASTSVVYTPGEDGNFVWEVDRAAVDGEEVPSVRIEFKRADEE